MMLTEIFQYLRNWFEITKLFSDFKVSDGIVSFSDGSELPLAIGQYFRIVGSALNDGVWKYGEDNLPADEVFSGAVWLMAVPPAVVSLAGEIKDWTAANSTVIDSPYQSENFGGYSYSLKVGENGTLTWKSQFAARLAPWRKI